MGWAFSLTKDIVIPETDVARKHRAEFAGFEKGSSPPKVILGESLGSCRYWHGTAMTRWANDWTRLHTQGEGEFVMTNMEDHGICTAMERMAKLGKVDFKRLLFLRTGSNYCTPRPGQKSSESMTEEYSGMEPALESAWLAGSKVMDALVGGWATFEKTPPKP